MSKQNISFMLWARRRIVTGMLVIVPAFVTIWLTGFLYLKLTSWAVRGAERIIPAVADIFWMRQSIRFATLVLIIVILVLVGEFARYKLGRWLFQVAEWVMMKLPMLSTIYGTTRQISEALMTPRGNMFRKVVLLEYPRKGIYAIGFLTSENKEDWEIGTKTGKKLISVFLPTTPNPTSGFLLLIPKEDCIILDMKVADGMRLVISGGAVKSGDRNVVVKSMAERDAATE
jgi:uncharacterized membrane protein